MYNFTFSLTAKDIFNSSMNYSRNSKTRIFDIIFTVVVISLTLFNIFTGNFLKMSILNKFLLILFCIMFPIINPIIIYIKSYIHYTKIKNIVINMMFENEKLTVSSEKEMHELTYDNIYNFIKYKNMLVIMYDSIHGQIMPNRIFNNNKDEFYDFLSSKILYAREKQKEKQ